MSLLLTVTFLANAQDPKDLKTEASEFSAYQSYKLQKLFDNAVKEYSLEMKKVGEDVQSRFEYERMMLVNPETNELPEGIFENEVAYASGIQDENLKGRGSREWRARGPFNVGGRTRALAIDRTNENVILAGGVSGGLWRSEDQGATWKKITQGFQHPSITCIVQDPRPFYSHIWYYGTGERTGNSASASGAFYQGNGIFTSFNGGRSFFSRVETEDDDPVNFSPFDLVSNIAVDPDNGDVYISSVEGIYRSTNFARTFTQVLEGAFPNWSDIVITAGGTFYATIEADRDSLGAILDTPDFGVFTSQNGTDWTNITPEGWAATTGRTVIGYAPSSENIVYAFAEDEGPSVGFLWEYNTDSTVETGWTNLSANLPTIGGSVGSLNTQTSYNLVVKVHPTNPNLVFVGGTNLYRSTTAFRTPAGQESWVAGYSPLNDVSLYTNQHPDQHELVFFPSNPDRALSGNDGGVYLAEDITETNDGIEPVAWTDLNNGYLTTQPYVVAIDPEGEDQNLLSGFQDNGTWFTDSEELQDPWISDFGGDGAYAAIADGGLTRYVSAQRGVVFRLNFNEEGENVSFTRVQPAGGSGFGFIAPFILDANNDNVMYMPAGNRIWRNNDLDGIPLFSNAPTDVNWVEMTNSVVPSAITSLDVSRYPEANKLYFGTNLGGIYRIDNANIDVSSAVDLSTGKGLPEGNVVCVTVDPNNSDNVFVVFSNYGIRSIFFSDDAGENWSDISGNLEENPDGSGSGPSIRWLAVQGNGDGYYVGTSVGLYFSNKIQKNNQNWWRIYRSRIGETVVAQVKTRKDGFVAVATHGNGMYSAFDFVNESEEADLSVAFQLDDYSVDLNAPDTTISVAGLFLEDESEDEDESWNWWHWWKEKENEEIEITLVNSNPDVLTATLDGDEILISYLPDAEGSASIGLIATLGDEQVAEGFLVTVAEQPFYEQFEAAIGTRPSQNFLDFGSVAQTAADITVPEGQRWVIQELFAPGGTNNAPFLTSATVVIYEDAEGFPGDEIYNSGELAPVSDFTSTNLELELAEPAILESGSYWVSIYVNLPFTPNATQWFWRTQGVIVGEEGFFRDQGNLFGLGAVEWTPASIFGTPSDQIFQLFGMVTDESDTVLTEMNPTDLLAEASSQIELKIWPNPSASSFSLNFSGESMDLNKQIAIYDLNGNTIMTRDLKGGSSDFLWDASSHPTGLYLIRVSVGGQQSKVYTVLKR
ncbi:MAG: T9SS type A sorting domain-containing protein [Bacteroidota bacterium]